MTSNPFHPDSLDPIGKAITILKGDSPGHPFRGNQYIEAASGILAMKADEVNGKVNNDGGDGDDHSDDHYGIADSHYELSSDLARKAEEATSVPEKKALLEASQAHIDASNAHTDAAQAHEEVAGFQQTYGRVTGPNFEEPVQHMEASNDAAIASQKANEITQKALAVGREIDAVNAWISQNPNARLD